MAEEKKQATTPATITDPFPQENTNTEISESLRQKKTSQTVPVPATAPPPITELRPDASTESHPMEGGKQQKRFKLDWFDNLKRLIDMGYPRDESKLALIQTNGNLETALSYFDLVSDLYSLILIGSERTS